MAQNPLQKLSRYLVELSVPEAGWQDIDRLIHRARAATNGSSGDVRFVRAVFVPEDSTCLLLYEAGSAREAADAAAAVELGVERVSEVVRGRRSG